MKGFNLSNLKQKLDQYLQKLNLPEVNVDGTVAALKKNSKKINKRGYALIAILLFLFAMSYIIPPGGTYTGAEKMNEILEMIEDETDVSFDFGGYDFMAFAKQDKNGAIIVLANMRSRYRHYPELHKKICHVLDSLKPYLREIPEGYKNAYNISKNHINEYIEKTDPDYYEKHGDQSIDDIERAYRHGSIKKHKPSNKMTNQEYADLVTFWVYAFPYLF